MKIRSAVPENGCLIFCGERKKNRKKNRKNICKTYTLPPHRRLRKNGLNISFWNSYTKTNYSRNSIFSKTANIVYEKCRQWIWCRI